MKYGRGISLSWDWSKQLLREWDEIQKSICLIKQRQWLENIGNFELGLGQRSQFPALWLRYWSSNDFVCASGWCKWNQWPREMKYCRAKILLCLVCCYFCIYVSKGVDWQCFHSEPSSFPFRYCEKGKDSVNSWFIILEKVSQIQHFSFLKCYKHRWVPALILNTWIPITPVDSLDRTNPREKCTSKCKWGYFVKKCESERIETQ